MLVAEGVAGIEEEVYHIILYKFLLLLLFLLCQYRVLDLMLKSLPFVFQTSYPPHPTIL